MNVPRFRLARLLLLIGLPMALLAADPDPLQPAEKAAGEWIKTRLETVRLENSWQSERPLLESTVNGLKERARELEERRDHVKAKTARDRDELEAMQAKNKAAADDMQVVEGRLQALGRKLAELRPSLPPRLSEALELSFRSLAGSGLSTGERMQLTMNVLNRCAQFNRMVTCGEEVLDIEGEQGPRSLEVIYWGLSRAYALDRAAGKAWYGSPGPQGWRWEPRPDATRPVTELIAIYNDKADPDFVAVPAAVGHAAAEGAVK
jgi:Protein of unknown function (DUF3450)